MSVIYDRGVLDSLATTRSGIIMMTAFHRQTDCEGGLPACNVLVKGVMFIYRLLSAFVRRQYDEKFPMEVRAVGSSDNDFRVLSVSFRAALSSRPIFPG